LNFGKIPGAMPFSITTLSIMTLSIKGFYVPLSIKGFYATLGIKGFYETLSISDTQHKWQSA
jgi:hypothetical protein